MKGTLKAAGLGLGLILTTAGVAFAQGEADTARLAALGTWPTVALNDSSFITPARPAANATEPSSSEKFKEFIAVNASATAFNPIIAKESLKRLNTVIKTNRRNAKAYAERGKIKLQLNDLSGSVKDFSVALQLAPAQTETYFLRGVAYFKQKDYLGAIQDITKGLEAEPTIDGLLYRAKAKAKMLDYRGCIDDNSKVLEMEAENVEALYNRAVARFYLKDYYRAIADFSQVLELQAFKSETYFYRGLSRHFTGDTDGGCFDLSKAGELGFENAYEEIKKICR